MSTPNTASNFISAINQSYPTAGQDNNSQGFRNNFKNIKQALSWIDNDVYDLQINGVKKTENNNFNNNIIEKATFKDCAVTVFDNSQTVQTGDVIVDYEKGNYQKFKVSAGLHTFTFINWPDTAKSGKILLSVISDNVVGSSINFGAVTVNNVGPITFPMNISGTLPNVFEIWNEGDNNTIFVYSYDPASNESTLPLSLESLSIGTNTYSTVTNSYAKYATAVKANNKAGNIALVPNKILCTVANASLINVDPGTLTATGFKVNSTNGLMANATFDLPLSTNLTKYSVTTLTTDTVTVTPPFEITAFNIGDVITFVNPAFNDQPTVVTFKPTAQTTTTSVPNDLKGTVYASSSTLYVSHSDYVYNNEGWIKVSADHVPKQLIDGSTAITQPNNDDSTKIATTEFVKNSVDAVFAVPAGGIILWSGSIANIPAGWALCDGDDGTPDLRDRFVVGAGNTYAVGSSGGSLTTGSGGDHDHGGTNTTELTVSNEGWSTGGGAPGTITQGTLLAGSGNLEIGEVLESIRAANSPLSIGSHSHSIPSSGNHTHSILPPYYALCYIMKL